MAQTTGYDFAMTVGRPGQLYDLRPHTIESFAAEVALAFGDPVRRGTNPDKQVLKGNATTFRGVALIDPTREQVYITGGAGFAIKDAVPVLVTGAAWVTVAVAVTAGQPAYVTSAGAYTNVSTSNLLVGEFLTSAGAAAVAVLEVA